MKISIFFLRYLMRMKFYHLNYKLPWYRFWKNEMKYWLRSRIFHKVWDPPELVRMQNGTAVRENGLSVSYRVKHTWPQAILLLGMDSRETKTWPYKHLYAKCLRPLSVTTPNCKHSKHPPCSWRSGWTVAHPCQQTRVSNEEAWMSDSCNKVDEAQEQRAKEKPHSTS